MTTVEYYLGVIKSYLAKGAIGNALTAIDDLRHFVENSEADTMAEEFARVDSEPKHRPCDFDDDHVNNPSHYQSYIKDGIDCITAMQHAFGIEATAIFCKLNAFKYIFRSSSKGGNTDIQKAQWYLNKYLELGGDNI